MSNPLCTRIEADNRQMELLTHSHPHSLSIVPTPLSEFGNWPTRPHLAKVRPVWHYALKLMPIGRLPSFRMFHKHPSSTTTSEEQWFPSRPSSLRLHSHTAASPYIGSSPVPLHIDVIQDIACPITEIHLSLDWSASLAKGVLRYRITFLAWTCGWLFQIVSAQTELFRTSRQYLTQVSDTR